MSRGCAPEEVCIGPYVAGEIPAPLEYQFLDSDGLAINITGYAARFIYTPPGAAAVTVTATVTDGVNGKVTYTWTGAELVLAGRYSGEVWIGNGVQRFASLRITWSVRHALGTVPVI